MSAQARLRALVSLFVVLAASAGFAQPIDIVKVTSPAHVRATGAPPPRTEAAPLPTTSFSVSRGIGILEDDGQSYWPGFAANFQAPATFRLTPTTNNTFMAQRVAYQFDDPAGGTVIYDGAQRPILGFLDANYIFPLYSLPLPITFAGTQYSKLSISTWGAVAFGAADTTQVNYDPTVVSSMFRLPMVAVWYELFYYPADARVIVKNKPDSIVITWQNLLSRHTLTRATFQVALFFSGDIQLSYQSLPVDHGLVGVSTGKETAAHQTAAGLTFFDLPAFMQVAQATVDDYSGVIGGVTMKLGAPPPSTMAADESYQYTLLINNTPAIGMAVRSGLQTSILIPTAKIPDFPAAQIGTWEMKLSGDTLSFRFPSTSIEPFTAGGANSWAIQATRFGGAGFVQRTVTQTLPLAISVRHTLLPASIGGAVEIPAEIFHYMPGQWDTDRIRESIAAYLVARGQTAVDSFRFFPTVYDDGLRHSNYAGTYPRQKSVTGVGTIPARPECDCHYGAEFSAVGESLADETTTMVALTHELAHEYTFYADYRGLDGVVNGAWRDAGVPCFGGAHPNNGLVNTSMFPDPSGAATMSVMGGSLSGSYQLNTPRFGLSRVEMYLMGLAAPSEVAPITFVQGSLSTTITIDQVIAANGPRTPAYSPASTRTFRVPTFVVKRQGESVSDAQLQQLQSLIFRWQSRFWHETGGRARANTTLDGGCAYTLSSTTGKPLLGGGAGSVDVLTDAACAWTAATSDAWITVTAGANGSGNGTVRYGIAANTTGAARSGTITIAGQPYTVLQPANGRRRAAP